MENSTFIKIHRKLIDWEWYKDLPTYKLFTHLLLKATYKDKRHQGILIKRGEILTGRIKLAEETGLTQQQVRTALDKLKATNEITIKTTNRFSSIKLVNYSLYQDKPPEEQPANQPATQPTDNQQITTYKERKEIKNIKEDQKSIHQENFKELWKIYEPLKDCSKGTKKKAEEAYIKLVNSKKHKHKNIIHGAKAYLEECRKTNTFSCHVSSFLNQERFTDYDIEAASGEFQKAVEESNKRKTMINKLLNIDKNTPNFKLVMSNMNFTSTHTNKITFAFLEEKTAYFITDTKFTKGNFLRDSEKELKSKLKELFNDDIKPVIWSKEEL